MMKQNLMLLCTVLIITLSTNYTVGQTPPPQTRAATQKTATTTPANSFKRTYRRSADTVKNTDFSLKGQYDFMLSRSRNLSGYKLINPDRLSSVWKSVNDTLKKERLELRKAKAQISQQTSSISGLKSDISEKETTLDTATDKINEINFLGISFSKGTYNIIVWSLIIGLALALFIVIARSAKNISEAKHRTELYEEINNEYQGYKAKSVEKERRLARELQDERNAMEELRLRGK